MIEGLKFTIKSDELRLHLEARMKFHYDRANFYEGQISGLRAGGLEANMTSADPMGNLERSAKNHRNKAGYFAFMAEHVVPNEEYVLSQHELQSIEIDEKYL